MAKLGKTGTLTAAELVYKHMEWLAGDEPTHYITVTGFTANQVSGLHFSNLVTGRQCNIVGHHVGVDTVVFNYGERDDYYYETGQAKESATREEYPIAQAHGIAQLALNWLTGHAREHQGDV